MSRPKLVLSSVVSKDNPADDRVLVTLHSHDGNIHLTLPSPGLPAEPEVASNLMVISVVLALERLQGALSDHVRKLAQHTRMRDVTQASPRSKGTSPHRGH